MNCNDCGGFLPGGCECSPFGGRRRQAAVFGQWVPEEQERADLEYLSWFPIAPTRGVAGTPAPSKPDPKKCTAVVRMGHMNVITTESCTTKRPLIDKGGSLDGERDYYECPDCGKSITIDYKEN